MLILVHSAPVSILRDLGGPHPNVGVLSSPRRVYDDTLGLPWAADNDAFLAWDESRFRRMLDTVRDMTGCLFVVAPDVVGDHEQTLERWHLWADDMRGLPRAFVAQDGLDIGSVPWDDMRCLFVGGTTAFKLGPVVHAAVVEAKRRGLWVHMGRVNTRRRFKWAASIGCDSVDGTAFSRFRRTHLPWALEHASAPVQLNIGVAA